MGYWGPSDEGYRLEDGIGLDYLLETSFSYGHTKMDGYHRNNI